MLYNFIVWLVAAVSFVTPNFCQAAPLFLADSSMGIIHHGKEKLDSLTSTGRVSLEGTTVVGMCTINGSLSAQDASIGEAKINGQAAFYGCTVHKTCDVSGFLSAENTIFKKTISVTSRKIEFENCTIYSIQVRKLAFPLNISQTVELKNCTVSGNINFESGNGIVLLHSNSHIKGKVEGGEIHKET